MEIVGNRTFIEVPDLEKGFELPPFFISNGTIIKDDTTKLEKEIVDFDFIDGSLSVDKSESGINISSEIAGQYRRIRFAWNLGDSVLKWVEQCKYTFSLTPPLSDILTPDVWPHVGQNSLVALLEDKYKFDNVEMPTAIGLRLIFRELPPISFFTNDFLFFFVSKAAEAAFEEWTKTPPPVKYLPPEKFKFEIFNTSEMM